MELILCSVMCAGSDAAAASGKCPRSPEAVSAAHGCIQEDATATPSSCGFSAWGLAREAVHCHRRAALFSSGGWPPASAGERAEGIVAVQDQMEEQQMHTCFMQSLHLKGGMQKCFPNLPLQKKLSETLLGVLSCLNGDREQHLINQLHQIDQALHVLNKRDMTRWTPEHPNSR